MKSLAVCSTRGCNAVEPTAVTGSLEAAGLLASGAGAGVVGAGVDVAGCCAGAGAALLPRMKIINKSQVMKFLKSMEANCYG